MQIRLLQLTIILPVIAIWGLAWFGATRFKDYSQTIKNSDDGHALGQVSNGLLVIATGLIISGLFASFRGWAIQNDLIAQFTITNSYLVLIFPLIGFGLMFAGSRQLLKITEARRMEPKKILIALVLVTAAIYIYARGILSGHGSNNLYLNQNLIWLTIVVPYALTWLLGTSTILNIATYQQSVKGIIYRQALRRLSLGLYVVVGFSIGLQLLTLLVSSLQTAGLSTLLIIIQILILFYGLGYLLIAVGAKNLAKIEAVH